MRKKLKMKKNYIKHVKTCHEFKTKNNFKMKENECLDRYKNKNDRLNKYVIGFKKRKPEYEIYLKNINSNKLPLIFQKNKTYKASFSSPMKGNYFKKAKSENKKNT